ncbi:hypothetical protein FEM48_Zijuj09G0027800 [Ziziphus jujuba var. spinosa]|uniref:Potassium transporter n=1 Tax=Ziziphus jujuba var. spinosa TaxID=714518 RepID=A0A978UQG2_ZIZJJ|nr:hypothetical protein FEM48_Zijuj09G0027800 [Ziziphus jujuba var. spinosa]
MSTSMKEEGLEEEEQTVPQRTLKRHDSLDIESRKFAGHSNGRNADNKSWSVILILAFQSIGIVYGDIGTSPTYVYQSAFYNGIRHKDDVYGVLGIILYTITLLPLVKYVLIVLRATDNGEGGTFALYSLICRYANVGFTPSEEAEDREVSNFQLPTPSGESILKSKLENSKFAKYFLLFATMLGTSMVIGDGILTPCISGGIGLYNILHHDPTIIKAINPRYIRDYFKKNKKEAWISLGGCILSITGTEALFADVGHFTVTSIRISTCCLIYPCLVLSYSGQAAVLHLHNDYASDSFYKSVPDPMYWPTFVMAVLASIIASQSLISGTFSMIQQSLSLGCFPRVTIVHTSPKYEGQIYVPGVNFLLMLACVAVTLCFRSTTHIGNAYGIAVVFVMVLTSSFTVLIMIMIWRTHILLIISYVVVIGFMELIYLSSVLYKFNQGGYLPLAFSAILMMIMFVWNDVYRKKYNYELVNKISSEKINNIISNDTHVSRVPGLAVFYSEIVQGIPPIFKHYVENVPALHSVLIFVSIKSLHISTVRPEERFLFRRVHPRDLNVYRCVARYGYTDMGKDQHPFEVMLVEKLKEYIKEEIWPIEMQRNEEVDDNNEERRRENQEARKEALEREIETIDKAFSAGVVHLIGENEVVAKKGANIAKKALINHAYNVLQRNLKVGDKAIVDIPHKRMLKVCMTYEL